MCCNNEIEIDAGLTFKIVEPSRINGIFYPYNAFLYNLRKNNGHLHDSVI